MKNRGAGTYLSGASFARLAPGAELKPHFGTHPRLTVHLGLVAPPPAHSGSRVRSGRLGRWVYTRPCLRAKQTVITIDYIDCEGASEQLIFLVEKRMWSRCVRPVLGSDLPLSNAVERAGSR